jgi:hypothetical protein
MGPVLGSGGSLACVAYGKGLHPNTISPRQAAIVLAFLNMLVVGHSVSLARVAEFGSRFTLMHDAAFS